MNLGALVVNLFVIHFQFSHTTIRTGGTTVLIEVDEHPCAYAVLMLCLFSAYAMLMFIRKKESGRKLGVHQAAQNELQEISGGPR